MSNPNQTPLFLESKAESTFLNSFLDPQSAARLSLTSKKMQQNFKTGYPAGDCPTRGFFASILEENFFETRERAQRCLELIWSWILPLFHEAQTEDAFKITKTNRRNNLVHVVDIRCQRKGSPIPRTVLTVKDNWTDRGRVVSVLSYDIDPKNSSSMARLWRRLTAGSPERAITPGDQARPFHIEFLFYSDQYADKLQNLIDLHQKYMKHFKPRSRVMVAMESTFREPPLERKAEDSPAFRRLQLRQSRFRMSGYNLQLPTVDQRRHFSQMMEGGKFPFLQMKRTFDPEEAKQQGMMPSDEDGHESEDDGEEKKEHEGGSGPPCSIEDCPFRCVQKLGARGSSFCWSHFWAWVQVFLLTYLRDVPPFPPLEDQGRRWLFTMERQAWNGYRSQLDTSWTDSWWQTPLGFVIRQKDGAEVEFRKSDPHWENEMLQWMIQHWTQTKNQVEACRLRVRLDFKVWPSQVELWRERGFSVDRDTRTVTLRSKPEDQISCWPSSEPS